MDLNPSVFQPIVLTVALLILIVYSIKESKDFKETDYYKCTNRPWLATFFLGKGSKGEYLTYKYLRSIKGYKRFLFNCYVPKENDETTEIDVLMLHETGIHVFESKNYSGWIYGSESSYKWTQVLPRGRRKAEKVHFLNPIIQNNGHIKWLNNLLGEPDIPFFSYIIFSERCTLKDIMVTSANQKVIKRDFVKLSVKKTIESNSLVLSKEEIDDLYEQLYPLTQTDEETKEKHIQQIKMHKPTKRHTARNKEVVEVENQEENMICPRCGGQLVLRVAKRGDNSGNSFYGCSNYPKCRYIKEI